MSCCYQQSKKCSDGSLSGLWLDVASIPASNTIVQGGTCYSFDGSSKSLFCHGTLHSGYSSVTDCSDATCGGGTGVACPNCPTNTTPSSVDVTYAGVTMCTACVSPGGPVPNISYKITAGSLDGTYNHVQVPGSPCVFVATFSAPTISVYNDAGGTCSNLFANRTGWKSTLTRLAGGIWSLACSGNNSPNSASHRLFSGNSASITSCLTPFTINNADVCFAGPTGDVAHMGSGGSAACSPNP